MLPAVIGVDIGMSSSKGVGVGPDGRVLRTAQTIGAGYGTTAMPHHEGAPR